MTHLSTKALAIAAAAVLGTATVAGAARAETVADLAARESRLGTFARLARSAGLEDILRSRGPYTVFAPTDAAFGRLPPAELQALERPENRERLRAMLGFHVAPVLHMMVPGEDGALTLPTLGGGRMTLARGDNQAFRVNGSARTVAVNIRADNGMLNLIDAVQVP